MGLFGSKGGSQSSNQSSTNQNTSSTTTPILPSYLSGGASSYYTDLDNFINYYGSGTNGGYGSQFIAPASADQTAAYNNAGTLGSYAPLINQAATATTAAMSAPANTYTASTIAPTSQVQAQSLLTGLQNYINPQINDVINTTDNLYNKQIGATNAALENQGALSNAFGGARFGVAQGEQNADNSMNEANVNANLYNQAFNQGATLSNEDADRRQSASTDNAQMDNAAALAQAQLNQQASQYNAGAQDTADARALTGAGLLGTLSTAGNANQIADINSQLATGDDSRSVAQAQDSSYTTLLAQMESLLGLNPGTLVGSTTNSTGNSNTSGSSSTATESVGFK